MKIAGRIPAQDRTATAKKADYPVNDLW